MGERWRLDGRALHTGRSRCAREQCVFRRIRGHSFRRTEDAEGGRGAFRAAGMTVVAATGLAASPDGYGAEGGVGGTVNFNLITVPNPVAGTWSVLVQAAHPYAD